MRVKNKFIAVLACGLVFVSACSSQTQEKAATSTHSTTQQKQSSPAAVPKHLTDIISYFKQKGFTIGAKSEKAYTMIGAIDGFGITVNNEPIELYEFDPKQSNASLEQVKKTGKLINSKAVTNSQFMLVEDNNDAGQSTIEKAFNNFQ